MAMPMYTLTRYEVRAEARDMAARAMHEHASFVRRELPDVSWTVYRDPAAPTLYTALVRSDDRAAGERHRKMFAAAFASSLVGDAEVSAAELVTSSDLQ